MMHMFKTEGERQNRQTGLEMVREGERKRERPREGNGKKQQRRQRQMTKLLTAKRKLTELMTGRDSPSVRIFKSVWSADCTTVNVTSFLMPAPPQ